MSSFQFPGRPSGNGKSNPRPVNLGRGGLIALILGIAVVVIAFVSLSGFYVDYLWYKSVHASSVWTTLLTTRVFLFFVFGLITSLAITSSMYIAFRFRPLYAPVSVEADNLEHYRAQIEPFRKLIFGALGVAIFYFAGMSGARLWVTWLQFKNSMPFGTKDPQFHMDISFFTFRLPFYTSLISWAISTVLFSLILSTVVHYIYGGIRFGQGGNKTTITARVQLTTFFGLLSLLKALAYWFDRYQLANHDGHLFTGLGYTDINAVLPAKAILAGISIICAILFFTNIVRKSWSLPIIGVALLAVSSLLIAGVYPSVIQQFTVKPSESTKEAPFIVRNVAATRAAYNLNNVTVQNYQATSNASAGQLAKDSATVGNIRLVDPTVVSQTFKQLQQIKPYYTFSDSLSVDRYTINGKKQDEDIAVRELNISGNPVRNWINDHLVYTHGFGIVAAPTTSVDADGKPNFNVSNIPPVSSIGTFQPRIYFGQNVPDYSIVGGTAKSTPAELDYPDDSTSTGQQNYTYKGTGGVSIGSYFNKLVFAVHEKDIQILLSNLVNKDSKVLYVRDPRARVAKVAPWLTLDGDPYPTVVNGRILWVVDGYTTSAGYPYSQNVNLQDATTNSLTSASRQVVPLPSETVNYIRNSVKATVDAYDGTVNVYQWDTADPVLKVWSKAFPGIVKPKSAIPSALLAHVRYPEDIFSVQRQILSTYHVDNANAFYGGQDFWRVPTDPSTMGSNQALQPPYYMTMQLPGASTSHFTIASSFVPRGNRQNLTAIAVANSDSGPDYGKITLLQLPRSTNISGPSQVASSFESDPSIAQTLSLLRQGGSDVVLGNLLTLPVGGGLLYVQPVYVLSTNNSSSYPLLQKVMVSFGDQIGFDNTLQGALDQIFGGNAGANVSGGSNSTSSGSTSSGGASASLAQSLKAAQQALNDAQTALKNQDFSAYGQAQNRLKSAIEAAISAQSAASSNHAPSSSVTSHVASTSQKTTSASSATGVKK